MAKFDDQRIATIVAGRRRIGRFKFPGSEDIEVGVRLLTETEADTARFNAHHYLEQRCKPLDIQLSTFINVDPESLDREVMRQIVFLALLDADSDQEKPVRFFNKFEEVRALDTVLLQKLYDIYVGWQNTVNPGFSLSKEKVQELTAALKKEQSLNENIILELLDRPTLTSLARFLANELANCQCGRSSTSES